MQLEYLEFKLNIEQKGQFFTKKMPMNNSQLIENYELITNTKLLYNK